VKIEKIKTACKNNANAIHHRDSHYCLQKNSENGQIPPITCTFDAYWVMAQNSSSPATPSWKRYAKGIPTFALYGETDAPTDAPVARLLHIESIAARSRQYGWKIEPHLHKELHQILWLYSGNTEVVIDGTRTEARGPCFCVIAPGAIHAYRFATDSEGFVLTVNATVLAEGDLAQAGAALNDLFAAPLVLELEVGAPQAKRIHMLFESLYVETNAVEEASEPVMVWLARAIVWRLAQQAQRLLNTSFKRSGRHGLYTRWLTLLETHYREHWTVANFAKALGLSPERLNRIVRTQTGHTAQHLIHDRLMREALRQLAHNPVPISKLAFELGFEDLAYFCRFFKRHSGLSPRAYRSWAQAGGSAAW
jgi:AraC family transcriptional activator of pobA